MSAIIKPLSEISPKLNAEVVDLYPTLSDLEVVFPSDVEDDEMNKLLSEMYIHAPNILIQEIKEDGVAIAIDCKAAFAFSENKDLLAILPEQAKRRLSQPEIRNKVLAGIKASLDESACVPHEKNETIEFENGTTIDFVGEGTGFKGCEGKEDE